MSYKTFALLMLMCTVGFALFGFAIFIWWLHDFADQVNQTQQAVFITR
jgi:hypothetical protein